MLHGSNKLAWKEIKTFISGVFPRRTKIRMTGWIWVFFYISHRNVFLFFLPQLIIFTPKSLLRHPDARSSFDDLAKGEAYSIWHKLCLKLWCTALVNLPYLVSADTKFKRLIPDQGPANQSPDQVKRVIFCTGKVYYELAKERKQQNLEKDVALIRLEQVFKPLSPVWTCCALWILKSIYLFFTFPCRSLHSHLIWSE